MDIYPSLISSDVLNLEKTIHIMDPHCVGYHLDVMDGHFVPNITWGPAFINAIRAKTKRLLHVHLMVTTPLDWLAALKLEPTDFVIIHLESFSSLQACKEALIHIRSYEYQVGLAINPSTKIQDLAPLVDLVDTVLLMSVKPGFSGQQFIPESIFRLQELIKMRAQKIATFTIGVDGGINEFTLPLLAPYAIDYIAIASALFSAPDLLHALKNLSELTHTKDIS